MNEIIKTLAVKVYGMADAEVQSLFEADGELKSDAVETLAKKDAELKKDLQKRLKEAHKAELTQKWNDAYSEAKKVERQKLEQEIKEKYGVETDKFGVDLVDEIVSLASKKTGDVKTHPDYIKLERTLQNEFVPKTEYEKIKTEYDEFGRKVQKDKVIGRVTDDARKLFRGLRPVLSKDPKKAANQEADFLNKFHSFDYELQEDGNHVVIKDGKRLENQNLNAIGFPELVKTMASEFFDFELQDEKGAVGAETQVPTSVSWKTKEEFIASYSKETDPAKRIQLMDAAKAKGLV